MVVGKSIITLSNIQRRREKKRRFRSPSPSRLMDQLTFSDLQSCTQMEVADTAGISQQIQQFSEWETEKLTICMCWEYSSLLSL